jgi:hypothetical protein
MLGRFKCFLFVNLFYFNTCFLLPFSFIGCSHSHTGLIFKASTINHPSSIIHHPSSIIHHPSSIIHHPKIHPLTMMETQKVTVAAIKNVHRTDEYRRHIFIIKKYTGYSTTLSGEFAPIVSSQCSSHVVSISENDS